MFSPASAMKKVDKQLSSENVSISGDDLVKKQGKDNIGLEEEEQGTDNKGLKLENNVFNIKL